MVSLCVLLVGSRFLWTGHLNTSGLGGSMNDQPGYIVTARNIAEHGSFESTIYYPAKVLYYKDHNVPYMPGNYYIRAIFFYLFGYSLFVSFLPNLLAFVGSSILLFLIAERMFDRTTAYVSTLVFMLFPPMALYAFSAMMENIFVFACLSSFYIFIRMPEKTRYILGVVPLLPVILIRETAIFMVFGYAAMIFLESERRSLWKTVIFLLISFSGIFLIYKLPFVSGRPPTFYARLINAFSLHYTDAYGLQNISLTTGETVRLVLNHFLKNVLNLIATVFFRPWDLGFLCFLISIVLFILSIILIYFRMAGNRQLAAFAIVTAFTELLAIFMFYEYDGYTGARMTLFLMPFFVCVVVGSALSGSLFPKKNSFRIFSVAVFVSTALFFLVALGHIERNYAMADEYDSRCDQFLKEVGVPQVSFFAAPFYISLDYVNKAYPVRWSFLPANEKTLKLLASRYPVSLLIIPSRHPLASEAAGNTGEETLLDGSFTKVDEKTFGRKKYLIFRRTIHG